MSYDVLVPFIFLAVVAWIGWSSHRDTKRIDALLARQRHPAE